MTSRAASVGPCSARAYVKLTHPGRVARHAREAENVKFYFTEYMRGLLQQYRPEADVRERTNPLPLSATS
jgi:hypothetical protein